MKDNNSQVGQLVSHIETVERWAQSPQAEDHAAWLRRAVAWDLVAAVKMTWAAQEIDDDERIDALLQSGLAEISAGPGDHVASLVNDWRRALGTARCQIGAVSEDDLRWLRAHLALPPPRGAGPASIKALGAYARRASEARDVVRIDCGGPARLLVGSVGGQLVPILRS